MKNHLPWALALSFPIAASACVLQTESVTAPSQAGWTILDEATGDMFTEGKVGIGTDAPAASLDVAGTVAIAGHLGVSGNADIVGDARAARYFLSDSSYVALDATGGIALVGGGVEGLDVHSDGNVYSPLSVTIDGALTVAGICIANCVSDARLKTNIEPVRDALTRLLQLRGVTYQWRDPDGRAPRDRGAQTGFVAQEVAATFPEWVHEGEDGYLRLQIRGFEALAVEAVRTVVSKNEELSDRIHALEETNRRLSSELQRLTSYEAGLKELTSQLAAERQARAALESRLAALEGLGTRGRLPPSGSPEERPAPAHRVPNPSHLH